MLICNSSCNCENKWNSWWWCGWWCGYAVTVEVETVGDVMVLMIKGQKLWWIGLCNSDLSTNNKIKSIHHHTTCITIRTVFHRTNVASGCCQIPRFVLFPNQFVSRSEIHVTPWMTANDVFTVAVLNKLCQQLFLYCHTKIRCISEERRFRFPVPLPIFSIVSVLKWAREIITRKRPSAFQPHHYSILSRRY